MADQANVSNFFRVFHEIVDIFDISHFFVWEFLGDFIIYVDMYVCVLWDLSMINIIGCDYFVIWRGEILLRIKYFF